MTFLAPWLLLAGGVAAAALVALHLIARQRPRSAAFPTARFIPERQVRAPSRAVWPTDLRLLLLRAAIVMLVAAAFARPVWRAGREGAARVVLVDRSRAVGASAEVADSARVLVRGGDARIDFDSGQTRAPGSLSAALIAGIRQARVLARQADSVELVVVSPFAEEEWDAATERIRALWPGRIRAVRVAPASAPPPRAGARIVRDSPTAADSSWARDSGGALVHWPDAGRSTDSSGAVSSGAVTVVAPFGRRPVVAESAIVIARWADGEPAAAEHPLGAGCVREVGIEVPRSGDLALRASYRRLLSRLTSECGVAPRFTPVDSGRLARFVGDGPRLAAAGLVADRPDDGRLPAMLLALAIALTLAELLIRRRGSEP